MLRFGSRFVNAPGVTTTITMATKTTTVQPLRLSSVASSSSPFPYGRSDFKAIRFEQQFFVDNTRHIRLLEQVGDENFFVRPPRFGKSLFVDTLHHYYDCATSQTEFDELFGGLDAHTNVTPLARSFHVLKLDLSTDFTGDVRQSFQGNVNESMLEFRKRYGLEFDINPSNCSLSLQAAADAVNDKGGKLYVLIDEYDRFANQLLVESYYQDRARLCFSVLRSFLETLKSISGGQECARSSPASCRWRWPTPRALTLP
jgi:hypothetical protein